jgi:hypothetical protein
VPFDDPRWAEYRAVLAKVDAKFAEIAARHPQQMACQRGCHGCCQPGLSVSAIEAAHIRAWLQAHPLVAGELRALAEVDPHRGARCALLDAAGQCSIYAARPLLCRVHGAPTRTPQPDGSVALDVCPLNFADSPLDAVESVNFIDQQLVATLLYVVGRRFDPADSGERTPLQPDALLGP